SIAGTSNDQKLAESITPAANPNIASNTFLLKFLIPNTNAAPSAVNDRVKNVAIRACKIGLASVRKANKGTTGVKWLGIFKQIRMGAQTVVLL
ncbi:MAG: hypothetical protein WCF07_08090, partial [Nitrososphaeraceae archaeon]